MDKKALRQLILENYYEELYIPAVSYERELHHRLASYDPHVVQQIIDYFFPGTQYYCISPNHSQTMVRLAAAIVNEPFDQMQIDLAHVGIQLSRERPVEAILRLGYITCTVDENGMIVSAAVD